MHKIIIPIDFSKCSEYACKTATRVAKKNGSEIHLLHMIEVPSGIINTGSRHNFSIHESMLYIRKVRDKMLEYKEIFFKKNGDIKHSIKFLPPFEGIKNYVGKINADLIIMGSRGHSKMEEILIGSNTERTVRTSNTPVLVIKKEEEKFNPKKIVFASDFSENIDKEKFSTLINFANTFKSIIHLLKINTPNSFESSAISRKKINAFIKKHELKKYEIQTYNDTSIENGILNYSNEIEADLIAIGTTGRSGLAHIFNTSISKQVTKNSNKPILTFKL